MIKNAPILLRCTGWKTCRYKSDITCVHSLPHGEILDRLSGEENSGLIYSITCKRPCPHVAGRHICEEEWNE
jgi:hypothetical protein